MEKKQNTPALRFRGFSGEWTLQLLNSYLDIATEINQNGYWGKNDVLSVSREYGIVNQTQLKGRSLAGASVLNYGVVHTGDVVYTKSPLKEAPYGIIKANKGNDGIVSTLYAIYKAKDTADPNFVQCYFDSSERLNKYLRRLVNKGAKNDMKVSDERVLSGDVIFPDKNEQTCLAQFLDLFEKKIKYKVKCLEKLHQFKKALLMKLFPREGAAEPELRFAGFSGPWEKYLLADFIKEIDRTDSTSTAPVMMITAASGFIRQAERYSFDNSGESLQKYILLKQGELAYNHGASKIRPFGSCFALREKEARVPFVYHCFSAGDQCAEFVAMELNEHEVEKQLRKLVSSSARMDGLLNISFEEYSTVSVLLPSIEEQKKIAKFFCQLDNFLSLEQKKLEQMRRLKAALLEKLFV